MTCLFNPGLCIQETFWNTIGLVPWWGWLVACAVLLGVAWRLGGIPGLMAAAAGMGFLFGRFRRPDFPTERSGPQPWERDARQPHSEVRPKPTVDGGVFTQEQIDHHPKRPHRVKK